MAGDGKLVTGPKGFRMVIEGVLPPSAAQLPEPGMRAFLASQLNGPQPFWGMVRKFVIAELQLDFQGQALRPIVDDNGQPLNVVRLDT